MAKAYPSKIETCSIKVCAIYVFASFSVKVSTIYLILMMLIIFILLATDYWVKRFGFMWGGGSSGMSGLKAMQVT